MTVAKKIKVGKKSAVAFLLRLQTKNLIVITGSKGYIMCGYLNMSAANKFGDVAVKVTGITTLKDALAARAASCSRAARKLGIRKGQEVRQVLSIIV